MLPFDNLSKDEENAFFASGVQDQILANLAKIADLKVISRTSVMNYKSGAGRNLPEIADALGVSHVVEGSVQRAGGRVRVTAQLIDAHTDAMSGPNTTTASWRMFSRFKARSRNKSPTNFARVFHRVRKMRLRASPRRTCRHTIATFGQRDCSTAWIRGAGRQMIK